MSGWKEEPLVRELELRYRPERLRRRAPKVTSATDVVGLVRDIILEPEEVFVVLYLDAKCRVRCRSEIARGTLSNCLVHPREVFKRAVLSNAHSIVCAHNHPSGDCEPSTEDRELTERLEAAGKILGIHVLDHVILAADGCYSFTMGNFGPIDNALKAVA